MKTRGALVEPQADVRAGMHFFALSVSDGELLFVGPTAEAVARWVRERFSKRLGRAAACFVAPAFRRVRSFERLTLCGRGEEPLTRTAGAWIARLQSAEIRLVACTKEL